MQHISGMQRAKHRRRRRHSDKPHAAAGAQKIPQLYGIYQKYSLFMFIQIEYNSVLPVLFEHLLSEIISQIPVGNEGKRGRKVGSDHYCRNKSASPPSLPSCSLPHISLQEIAPVAFLLKREEEGRGGEETHFPPLTAEKSRFPPPPPSLYKKEGGLEGKERVDRNVQTAAAAAVCLLGDRRQVVQDSTVFGKKYMCDF